MDLRRVSYLTISVGLVGVALVVPVLEVLVDGGLLGSSVLATHGSQTTAGLGRFAVQSLVEGSIARDVLAFESSGSHGEGFGENVGIKRGKEENSTSGEKETPVREKECESAIEGTTVRRRRIKRELK